MNSAAFCSKSLNLPVLSQSDSELTQPCIDDNIDQSLIWTKNLSNLIIDKYIEIQALPKKMYIKADSNKNIMGITFN